MNNAHVSTNGYKLHFLKNKNLLQHLFFYLRFKLTENFQSFAYIDTVFNTRIPYINHREKVATLCRFNVANVLFDKIVPKDISLSL